MKAWKVTFTRHVEFGSELVFAKTSEDAINNAESRSLTDDVSELVAEHVEYADNKENWCESDLIVLLLENNWEFAEYPVYGVYDFYGLVSLTKDDIGGIKEFGLDHYLIRKVDE